MWLLGLTGLLTICVEGHYEPLQICVNGTTPTILDEGWAPSVVAYDYTPANALIMQH